MEYDGDVFFDSIGDSTAKGARPQEPVASQVRQITIEDPLDKRSKPARSNFAKQKIKARKLYKEAKGKGKKVKEKVVTSTMSLLNSAVNEKQRGKWASKTAKFLFKRNDNARLANRPAQATPLRPMPPPPTASQVPPPKPQAQPLVPIQAQRQPKPQVVQKPQEQAAPAVLTPLPKLTVSSPSPTVEALRCVGKESVKETRAALSTASRTRSGVNQGSIQAQSATVEANQAAPAHVPTQITSTRATILASKHSQTKPMLAHVERNSGGVTKKKSAPQVDYSLREKASATRPKVTRGKGEIYKKLYGSAGFPSVA